jgi:hypothetical protein
MRNAPVEAAKNLNIVAWDNTRQGNRLINERSF